MSSRHSPEFAMLEWYRKGFDMEQLMLEVVDLVRAIHPPFLNIPVTIKTYQSLFTPFGINAHRDSIVIIRGQVIKALGYDPHLGNDRDAWLDCLFVSKIEPKLENTPFMFITEYPASMASLAKIQNNEDGDPVAKRFELYINGYEICNGYEELTDADEQAHRFDNDNQQRRNLNKPEVTPDNLLVSALRSGLPEMSGVAVGLDRLLMVTKNHNDISNVLAFPLMNDLDPFATGTTFH